MLLSFPNQPPNKACYLHGYTLHLTDKAIFLTLGGVDKTSVFGKCKLRKKSIIQRAVV